MHLHRAVLWALLVAGCSLSAPAFAQELNRDPAGKQSHDARARRGEPPSAKAAIGKKVKRRARAANRLSQTEKSLSPKFISFVQAALCVPRTGDLGPRGSVTRTAIAAYLSAGRSQAFSEVTPRVRALLQELVDVGDCKARGFETAYEVAVFGAQRARGVDRVKDFQRALGEALKTRGSSLSVAETGFLDARTREAIVAYRRMTRIELPGPRNSQVDQQLQRDITP